MNYVFVRSSQNMKTGAIPVSISPSSTCPPSCIFKDGPCYARFSFLGIKWKQLDKNLIGKSWNNLLNGVKDLPRNQIWRHNQAGDLAGVGERINAKMLHQLIFANKNKRGFTYTHKKVLGDSKLAIKNRELIKEANEQGFTINLSADNLEQADEKASLGIGPVVVVLPSKAPPKGITPQGRRYIVCLAQSNKNLTCEKCQICSKSRSILIGFLAHGSGKNYIK